MVPTQRHSRPRKDGKTEVEDGDDVTVTRVGVTGGTTSVRTGRRRMGRGSGNMDKENSFLSYGKRSILSN